MFKYMCTFLQSLYITILDDYEGAWNTYFLQLRHTFFIQTNTEYGYSPVIIIL